jgi:beta-1,4-mannosyl-glycoprotein beta-1,4-N-acetylglucosaminyltransferase
MVAAMIIWDTFMFRDELDVLEMRLESCEGWAVNHVLVESPVTFLGVPKPLVYERNHYQFGEWKRKIRYAVAPDPKIPGTSMGAAWVREHIQRQVAWAVLEEFCAEDDDIVLICDVDEIPSAAVLAWDGQDVAAVDMRTCIYAVDWECCGLLPPTCVVARVGYLRKQLEQGLGLGSVRDGRSGYPVIPDGGWHLSWLGGPKAQAEKLLTASFHRDEIMASPEGATILDGRRYREGAVAGGLAVKPVDVDESWPSYVVQRRCPRNWFRPR